MMWIVDISGPREDVLTYLAKQSHDALVADAADLVTHAAVEKKSHPGVERYAERHQAMVDRLNALNTDKVAASFDRAVAFAIAEVEQSTFARAGVTLRALPLPDGGVRVTADVSEYPEE